MLSREGSSLFVSIDAGTESTFYRVKGRDCYNEVFENLRRYSKFGRIDMKYILIEGVNDDRKDLDGFLELCKSVDAASAHISFDRFRKENLSEALCGKAAYLVGILRDGKIRASIAYNLMGNAERLLLQDVLRDAE
jgi:adenine C2-methylase RlmN of 23S rRNA A2503 and tRNA A37